jgi:hypothetical protein
MRLCSNYKYLCPHPRGRRECPLLTAHLASQTNLKPACPRLPRSQTSAMATALSLDQPSRLFWRPRSKMGGPANISTLVKVCLTTNDVYDALGINASAEVNSSWGSFSDRLGFAHSITQHTRTVNILVVSKKQTKTSRVISQKFKQTFKDATTLYQQGGDSFVSFIAWGGQYMVSYSFVTHDDTSYTMLVNSASAQSLRLAILSFGLHPDCSTEIFWADSDDI